MTELGPRYWLFVLARALPAAIVGVVITFSADHSVRVGALSLGVFAVVTAGLLIPTALTELSGRPRLLILGQGIVLAVGAILGFIGLGGSVAYLLYVTSAVFVVSGALELAAGLVSRGLSVARDWIFVGGLSVLFGLAVLLIPVDLVDVISVPDQVVAPLTAPTVVVGGLGAYAAIVAVYLIIAGLSLRWAAQPSEKAVQS